MYMYKSVFTLLQVNKGKFFGLRGNVESEVLVRGPETLQALNGNFSDCGNGSSLLRLLLLYMASYYCVDSGLWSVESGNSIDTT